MTAVSSSIHKQSSICHLESLMKNDFSKFLFPSSSPPPLFTIVTDQFLPPTPHCQNFYVTQCRNQSHSRNVLTMCGGKNIGHNSLMLYRKILLQLALYCSQSHITFGQIESQEQKSLISRRQLGHN